MSARVETYIDCNHPGCITGSERVHPGENLAEARLRLGLKGWASVRGRRVKDYCDRHAQVHQNEVKK